MIAQHLICPGYSKPQKQCPPPKKQKRKKTKAACHLSPTEAKTWTREDQQ